MKPPTRAFYPLAITATLFAVTACDSTAGRGEGPTTPAGTATSESAGPGTSGPGGQPTSPDFPALDIPTAATILVPVLHGTTSTQTPEFTIPRQKYTVYLICSGTGQVTLDDQESKTPPCDGRTRRSHVITGETSTVVHIRTRGSVRWSAAVVDLDGFQITPAPPSTHG